MAKKSAQQIVAPKGRPFRDHNVDRVNGKSIAKRAIDKENAREPEGTPIEAGFDGDTGGGGIKITAAYAYEITDETVEG